MAKMTHNGPRPVPAMLENSFSSPVENTVALINNQIAREGRLTTDPLAVLLRRLRSNLREVGFSFERIASETPATIAPPAAASAAKQTPTVPPAAANVRVIEEAQIAELQVPGTVDEATAPYGRDPNGRALAPYGVKRDGVPMKRRGRVAGTSPKKANGKKDSAVSTIEALADLDLSELAEDGSDSTTATNGHSDLTTIDDLSAESEESAEASALQSPDLEDGLTAEEEEDLDKMLADLK